VDHHDARRVPIRDLVRYYLRLGLLGFGGPVALVGQMERELVGDRGWVTKSEMREGIAVCQSLPGPLAIQVGIWLSYLRGGFWGAWAGGWAFILPNFVIVTVLGALYVHFGGLPWVTAIFYGVSPAVIALILLSCYRLAKLGMDDWLPWALAAVAFGVTIALRTEVAWIFLAAGAVGILYYGSLFRPRAATSTTSSFLFGLPLLAAADGASQGAMLGKLFTFFLKAGSLTFGSGLVIVPFLEKGLVQQTGWLNEREFLVAVAMGMMSPGPVVITATFVGYLVAGFTGALVATIGIFLPSFLPPGPHRGPDPGALPDQSQRAGIHQGSLRSGHRHDPRRLRAPGTHRHRRLAHRAHRARGARRAVSVEGEQSPAPRGRRRDRTGRVPAAPTGLGLREVGGPDELRRR